MTYIRATQARARGLGRGGIVFSDRLDKDAHLGRVQHADMFLDNHHVNAHTTASEALWHSVDMCVCLCVCL